MKRSYPNQSVKEKTGFLSFVRKVNLEKILFFLILLFLPTQFGKHFWPDFSYVSGIRIDYLSPTLYLTDVLISALLILLFIKNLKNGLLNKARKHRTFLIHAFLITIFLVFNILNSENKLAGIYGIIKIAEFTLFSAVTYIMLKKIKIQNLLPFFSISVIVQSIISIAQYIRQESLGGVLYFLGERTFSGQTPGIANLSIDGNLILRPYGTFSHPNVLAGFLLIFLTIILFKTDFRKKIGSICLIALILGSVGLLLSFSRLPILLWILSISVFMYSRFKLSLENKAVVILILLAFIFSIAFYSPFYLRFVQSSLFEESFVLREKLFAHGFSIFAKNPLIGAGVNNYLSGFVSLGNTFVIQPVHNVFMLVLIQTGIIGFAGLLFFIYRICVSVFKKKSIYIKLIFAYVLIIGSFDHYFLTLQQGQLMLAFIIGLTLSKNE